MKAGVRLQVGDKVVLHPYYLPSETRMKPRPVHGQLYCVRAWSKGMPPAASTCAWWACVARPGIGKARR